MRSVDRLVQLMRMLSESDSGVGVMKLAEQLQIPASTAHRLLNELSAHHLVTQEAAG